MNETQQALFLWSWSRKRRIGRLGIIGIGAGVGALAGLVMFLTFFFLAQEDGGLRIAEYQLSPWLAAFARAIGPTAFIFLACLAPFAFVGVFTADRMWRMQEPLYQALLAQGARVPSEKPRTKLRDWIPTILVLVVFGLLVIGLMFGVWWELWGKQ